MGWTVLRKSAAAVASSARAERASAPTRTGRHSNNDRLRRGKFGIGLLTDPLILTLDTAFCSSYFVWHLIWRGIPGYGAGLAGVRVAVGETVSQRSGVDSIRSWLPGLSRS